MGGGRRRREGCREKVVVNVEAKTRRGCKGEAGQHNLPAAAAAAAAELSGAVVERERNDDWSCECGRVGECVQVQLVCARKEKCGDGGLTGARGSCVAVDVRCGRRRLRIHTYLQRIHA